MNILITGGSGFVGRHLLEAFRKAGDSIINFDFETDGDITNLPALKQAFDRHYPDIVIHLAKTKGINPSRRMTDNEFLDEIKGTLNILECVKNSKAKLIYPSSAAVNNGRPVSDYGLTKQLAEDMIRYQRDMWGMDVVILRFQSIYGEGGYSAADIFEQKKKAGEKAVIHGGNQGRYYLHVDDAVDLYLKVAHKLFYDEDHNEYDVDGDCITILELAELIGVEYELASPASPILLPHCPDMRKELKKIFDWEQKIHLEEYFGTKKTNIL